MGVQWNSSNPDTNGTEQSVRIKEYTALGGKKCLIIIRERCPHFSGVLREGLDCITGREYI